MTDSSHDDPTSTSTSTTTTATTTIFHDFSRSAPASSSAAALKALPRPLSIRHSQSYEPAPPSPTGDSPVNELRGVRSSASLNLLASSMPLHQYRNPQDGLQRSQILPSRSSPFSNPFKKLQNTFGNSKRSLDLGNSNGFSNPSNSAIGGNGRPDRIVSSSSSANSLTSWRSKGAEMLSKSWGRNRKNSEPLLKNVAGAMSGAVSGSPIFGTDLEEAIRVSHIPDTPQVPAVLHRCAEFLEAKGVDEVGLYRIPGSHASVQRLKRMFDTGRDFNLLEMDGIDPNDIATLLKLYLRELPSPLMPPVLLQQFQSLLTTDRHICHTLRKILIRLPRHNYVVLSYLCHHLSKIAAHADKTKMTISNLGVVFAPTLAIGSVLFKALLGGFYDGVDTPENREKGLKIVWGGYLQDDAGKDIQEWPEDDDEGLDQGYGEKEEYDDQDQDQDNREHSGQQLQEAHIQGLQQFIRHQQSMPAMSPFSDHYASSNNSSYFPTVPPKGVGPLDLDDRPVYGQVLVDPFSSAAPSSKSSQEIAEHEESALMNAMLEREELAARSPPPSSPRGSDSERTHSVHETSSTIGSPIPPSHLTSTATIPNNLTTTSTSSSISNEANKVADVSLSPPSMAIPTSAQSGSALNITIDAGTIPTGAASAKEMSPATATATTATATPSGARADADRSKTEAPQLPPLDALSISL